MPLPNGELYKYEFTNMIREHCRNEPKITNQTRDRLLQSGDEIFAAGGWGATSAVSFHEFARIACKSQARSPLRFSSRTFTPQRLLLMKKSSSSSSSPAAAAAAAAFFTRHSVSKAPVSTRRLNRV